MSWILVVTVFTVSNGWIIGQDKNEIRAPSQPACEAAKRAMDTKLRARKGSQFMTICRPDWTTA